LALLIVLALIVVRFSIILILSGGDFRRIRLAIRGSWRTLRDPAFADKVQALLEPPPPPPPAPPPKPSGAPLRLLALLQREGRLLDFLLEDIQSYPDAQIGAAVRDIHRQCQHAVKEHLDRKSTRLNSSHEWISYAVFCLKKKKQKSTPTEGESSYRVINLSDRTANLGTTRHCLTPTVASQARSVGECSSLRPRRHVVVSR